MSRAIPRAACAPFERLSRRHLPARISKERPVFVQKAQRTFGPRRNQERRSDDGEPGIRTSALEHAGDLLTIRVGLARVARDVGRDNWLSPSGRSAAKAPSMVASSPHEQMTRTSLRAALEPRDSILSRCGNPVDRASRSHMNPVEVGEVIHMTLSTSDQEPRRHEFFVRTEGIDCRWLLPIRPCSAQAHIAYFDGGFGQNTHDGNRTTGMSSPFIGGRGTSEAVHPQLTLEPRFVQVGLPVISSDRAPQS